MIASRSILREVKITLPDERGTEDFVRLQIAFAHCLRMTLRKQPQTLVLGNYLQQDALQKVVASHSPANRILLLMGSGWRFVVAVENYQISYFIASITG